MELVAPGIWKVTLGTPERFTPVALRETKPLAEALARLPAAASPPFDEGAVRFSAGPRGSFVELPLGPAEHLFGFGLQLRSHDQRGRKKHLRVNSDPVADTGDSHAPVPFYVSTAGYGVYVDTARYVSFYCGTNGRASVSVEVPLAPGADLYLFAGPDTLRAVQRYVLFSGGGCLPPLWGLGVWYRASGKASAADVARIAGEIRAGGLPCDVMGLEPSWQTHTYSCTYVWDRGRFPDPAGTLRELEGAGFHVNLWEHAFVHPDSPLREPLRPSAGDVEVWRGLVPDFTDRTARQAFADYHAGELVAAGVTGFKLDECDNSDFVGQSWSFPEHSRFPSGLDGEQMHCLLGVLYQRTIGEVFRRANVRTYSQVRSSGALAAPLPFVLYSDLYDHADFLRGTVNAGFSGLLWSPEVRQSASAQELVRRIEAVVLSPHALVNAWMVRHPPWQQFDLERNNRDELLPEGERERLTAACRELFRLRMSLVPYLYAAFARYRLEGMPPFRSLAMDWPADPNAWTADTQYMAGDALLVAPYVADRAGAGQGWDRTDSREVYLPAGRWHDFWADEGSDKVIDGGATIRVELPLGKMPLFVRSGTVLPLAEPVEHVAAGTCFDLTVRVYGQSPARAELFEDDGVSFDFEEGRSSRVELSWSPASGGSVRRTGGYGRERYRVTRWEAPDRT